MAERIHLVRDVLDKQLIDVKHAAMGKVDGVVLELRTQDGEVHQPRVTQLENGFPVLARRIHPRLRRWVAALGWRFGARRGATYRIPISRVLDVERGIQVELVAEGTPILEWERVLRRRVIKSIPGSGQ